MTNDLKPLDNRRKGYTPPEEALKILEGMEIKQEQPDETEQKDERGGKEPAGLEGKVNIVLDESAADKGKKRLQDKWFGYWNNVKDGRVMASMGDLYIGFKEINRMHEEGTEQERDKAGTLLAGLRDDFDWLAQDNWLVSSTRMIYSPNSLDSRIVQRYKCRQPELVKETDLTIPVYRRVSIAKVTGESQGLNYLQSLLDTVDDAETIIQTLEFVSGKNRSNIKIWTPPLSNILYVTRSNLPGRAAGFRYNDGVFHVVGGYILNVKGCSRWVLVDPH